MTKTYIVVCDPSSDTETMTKYYLRTFPCVRIMPNAWIIQSDEIATYLHNLVIEPMQPKGDIFTAEITGNYEGYQKVEVLDLIKALKRREPLPD
jgi:hypothetical protein